MLSKQKPIILLNVMIVLMMAVLAACGKSSSPADVTPLPTESAFPTATPTATPTVVPSPTPSPMPTLVAPLTGLPVEQAITERPIAVMINNLKPARPQSGLTNADIVWELMAEGGITRLVAIFQSQSFAEPIGPIRSIRPYFIQLIESYQGVIVHAGASNDGYKVLQKSNPRKEYLDEISNAGSYFFRDKSRKAPHNLYATLDKLREGAKKKKYREDVTVPNMLFDPAKLVLTVGLPAKQVDITFRNNDYKVSYAYDATTRLYARSINDEPHTDLNNDKQLTAANLVVLATKHVTLDKEGRLEVDLNMGGDALLIQAGEAIPAKWERKDGDIVRLMKDGKELPFMPGVTFYHVVSNQAEIDKYVTYK